MNNLNEINTVSRTGTTTVAGTTTSAATNVTVDANSGGASNAIRYADYTFARTNVSLLDGNNTFTAIGKDNSGRSDTNAVTLNLPASVTLAWDKNGNLRTNGTRFFDYDDENQLVRITEPSTWKSEFTCDGRMRRRVRKEFIWQNSAWVQTNEVRYVYDGDLVIQERDGFNLPTKSYTRGNDLSGSLEGAGGIGGLLALTLHALPSIERAYYHCDGNGNVTALMDSQERVVARYLYDPFGNTLSASGPAAELNLYRFSSKELHAASGLVYYLYRFYEPNLQRWPNRDPIDEEGGFNLYTFVSNDPVDYSDAFGWITEAECFKKCMDDRLNDAKTFCTILGAYAAGAAGNIPAKNGRPIASVLARRLFYGATRGLGPTMAVPRMTTGIAVGANAAAAARAAAIVGAFMGGYAAGTATQCYMACFQYPGPIYGRPPTFRNDPPNMIIR